MIKLNRHFDALESVIEKIEAKIEELEAKMEALEEAAADEDRDMTSREWERFFKYEEQIEELNGEIDDIQNALDYLRDYTE